MCKNLITTLHAKCNVMANKELRIRELCKERGITQVVLAKRLGYNNENGAIS